MEGQEAARRETLDTVSSKYQPGCYETQKMEHWTHQNDLACGAEELTGL